MVNMSSVVFNTNNSKSGALPLQYYNKNINSNTSTPKHQISTAVKMFKYQNIAPAPTIVSSDAGCAGAEIKTRKYTPRAPSTGGGPYSVDQTQSVQRRNARERNRVKQVNNSFSRLRQHIPQTIITDLLKGGGRGPHKKISKVDTLRIAVEYIRRLQDLVDDLNAGGSNGGATQKCMSSRGNTLLMAATDNNTTSSNSSYSSSATNSSNASSNLSLQAAESSAHNSPQASGLAAAEELYFASAANNALQAAYQQQQQQHQQQFTSSLLTTEALQAFSPQPTQTQAQLDIGCPSPSSSFNSSMSFDSGTFVHSPAPQQQLSPLPQATSVVQRINSSGDNNAHAQIDANLQLKFEPYDNFNLHEEDCTPDDEEILDYISLWQEQ